MDDEETKQRRHQLWIDVLTEAERVGFTEEEQQVVLAPMRLRPSKIVEAEGAKYSSPSEWSAAIEHALMQERLFIRSLHEVQGFPDTENMDMVQGHFARLAHLVSKYPEANWDLLMQDQDTAMSRKPTAAKPLRITVQVIEFTKKVFLNLYADRKHMMATGNLAELAQVSRTMERKRRVLQSYGVDPDVLLSEHATEVERLVAERANEVAPENSQPVALKESSLFDAASDVNESDGGGVGVKNSEVAEAAQETASLELAISEPSIRERVKTSGFINAREIADRLELSYDTALKYLKQGRIPHASFSGHKYRVKADDFEKWFTAGAVLLPAPVDPATTPTLAEPVIDATEDVRYQPRF